MNVTDKCVAHPSLGCQIILQIMKIWRCFVPHAHKHSQIGSMNFISIPSIAPLKRWLTHFSNSIKPIWNYSVSVMGCNLSKPQDHDATTNPSVTDANAQASDSSKPSDNKVAKVLLAVKKYEISNTKFGPKNFLLEVWVKNQYLLHCFTPRRRRIRKIDLRQATPASSRQRVFRVRSPAIPAVDHVERDRRHLDDVALSRDIKFTAGAGEKHRPERNCVQCRSELSGYCTVWMLVVILTLGSDFDPNGQSDWQQVFIILPHFNNSAYHHSANYKFVTTQVKLLIWFFIFISILCDFYLIFSWFPHFWFYVSYCACYWVWRKVGLRKHCCPGDFGKNQASHRVLDAWRHYQGTCSREKLW